MNMNEQIKNDIEKVADRAFKDTIKQYKKGIFKNTEEYNLGLYIDDSCDEEAEKIRYSTETLLKILATIPTNTLENSFQNIASYETLKTILTEVYQDFLSTKAIEIVEEKIRERIPDVNLTRE